MDLRSFRRSTSVGEPIEHGEAAPEPTPERSASGVSARWAWALIGLVAVAGAVFLAALFMGLGARAPLPEVSPPVSAGRIAALVGAFPAEEATLSSPRSVTVVDDRVYVTEPDASRIAVFGLDGRAVRTLELSARGTVYPVDCARVGDSLFVVDAAGERVLAVPERGGETRRIAEELKQPTAVLADGGDVLIADAGTGLWRFDPASRTLSQEWDSRGVTLFVSDMVSTPDGTLLLTDAAGARVLTVTDSKTPAKVFGARVSLPRGVAVDASGRVWVADVFGGTVFAFDSGGGPLGDLEAEAVAGPEKAGLSAPQGVAFSADGGRLFVADSVAGKVFVWALSR